MRYYLIDAFSDRPFGGNPAAVCLLDRPLSDEAMAALAGEFALSETAFLLREAEGWRLRWFSPTMEIPLCGHGTLATARAVQEAGLAAPGETLRFATRSGELRARLDGDWIELDFPARPAKETPLPDTIKRALGLRLPPRWTGMNAGRNWLLEVDSADEIRDLSPDRSLTMALAESLHGIIVTARGDARHQEADGAAISSRFFAPEAGVFEDPVTGSAHCALAPYWAPLLGTDSFLAYQASKRGGLLRLRLAGERVFLAGRSALVAAGSLAVFRTNERAEDGEE